MATSLKDIHDKLITMKKEQEMDGQLREERRQYAMAALTGMNLQPQQPGANGHIYHAAKTAWAYADAMIAAENEKMGDE